MGGEVRFILSEMDRVIWVGHPVCWDFSDVTDRFVGPNADLRQLKAMFDGSTEAVVAKRKEFCDTDESVVEVLGE